MTAAGGRAEAHLRLLAEDELRRALAYPRCEPAEPAGLPPAVRSAVHLSRPVLAPLLPPLRSVARVSGPLLASFWPTARTAASAARRTGAGRAAEPVLWRALRVRPRVRGPQPGDGRFPDSPPAVAGLNRVRWVASALVAADAISEPAAQAVIEELTDALAVRGKLAERRLRQPPSPRWWGPGSPWRPGSPPPPLPAGPVQAVALGTALSGGPAGGPGEISLLALVLAPDRAVLTAGQSSQPGPYPGRPGRRPAPPLSSGPLTLVDNHGVRYQADADYRLVYGHWSAVLDLVPVPPSGIRWLDITGDAAHDPVRVDLARDASRGDSPGPDPAAPGPGGLASLPPRLSPAERPLDTLAESLLAEATHGFEPHGAPPLAGLAELAELVGALQAGAGLEAGSAALGRLAALADRLGIGFPSAVRPLAQPAGLPDAWLSVLQHCGATDGPVRVAAAAAVLPEVDGARFAVAGLDSAADSATLRVVAWGWQPSPLTNLLDRFSWWARDDRGRWHLARTDGSRSGGGPVDLFVEFAPALHPDARSLDLFLRGPRTQAAVTLPLRWLASR
jgi:hypothetical protein